MTATIIQFRRSARPQQPQLIARIWALLVELEVLSHRAKDVPMPVRMQTRETVEQARIVLEKCARKVGKGAKGANPQVEDDDPQPDIDRELLERMYREMTAGHRPIDR